MTAHKVNRMLNSARQTASAGLKLAAAAMMLCALSACNDTNEPETPTHVPTPEEPQLPGGHTYISMIVQTGSESSRDDWEGPTWGDFYTKEGASEFERAIDPSRIHVTIYDTTGNALGNLDSGDGSSDVVINTISDENGIHQIYFDISELGLETGEEYIASVIINYSGVIDNSQVENSAFSMQNIVGATGGTDPTDYYRGRIPMFGFIRWSLGNHAEQEETYKTPIIGTIELLRAVCKLEVCLGDPEMYPETAFMSIDMNNPPHLALVNGRHINTRGYIVPEKDNWINKLKNSTRDITFQESFRELIGYRWTSETTENLVLPAHSADQRMFYIYLPEASGLSLAPNFDPLRLNVTVTYDNPDDDKPARTVTGTLFPSIYYDEVNQQYPVYSKFDRWKLTRNHIYRFTITDLANETAMKYNVSVAGEQVVTVPPFD